MTKVVTEAAVRWCSNPFNTMVVTELVDKPWGGRNRFDIVAVTPNDSRMTIVEVKVSRADFFAGSEKFSMYMKWCNSFYVAAPRGMIQKDELPDGVGLLAYGDTGKLRRSKWATDRPLDAEIYTQMLNRVVQKLCVSGSRASQELAWAAASRKVHFRQWVGDSEAATQQENRVERRNRALMTQRNGL
jgi:hypothetical protein